MRSLMVAPSWLADSPAAVTSAPSTPRYPCTSNAPASTSMLAMMAPATSSCSGIPRSNAFILYQPLSVEL